MTWSISEPVADWPPSVSHMPGTIAEKYGPPDAGDEARLARDRHVARRGAADQREPRLERLRRDRGRAVDARAEHAEAAGVRVDDRRRRPAVPGARPSSLAACARKP